MIPEELNTREHDLRRAVERQQFAHMNTLIMSYCQLAETCAIALPADHPDRSEIVTRVFDVLEWARLMIHSSRSACADELNRLPLVNFYLESVGSEPSGLRLDC